MQYKIIAKQLLELYKIDQQLRKNPAISVHEVFKYDRQTTKVLRSIIEQIGWPTISKVGKKASEAAWCLAQHTHNQKFACKCLHLMKKHQIEINITNIAYLEDKVALHQTGYQIYGTCMSTKVINSNLVTTILPVKNPEMLEARRKNIGLDSLEQQKQRYEQVYLKFLRDKH